jgi:hypothetical protein
MTFDLAGLLASSHVPNVLVRNAMVETFPVHVRQLTDFFWKGRSSTPRVNPVACAADYFDPGEWAALRPEKPADLDAVLAKVGWVSCT